MSDESPTLPGTSTVVPDAEPIVGLVSESEKKIRKKNTTKSFGKPPPATEPTTVEATPPTTPPVPKSKTKPKPKPRKKKKSKIPKKPKTLSCCVYCRYPKNFK